MCLEIQPQTWTGDNESESNLLHRKVIQFSPLEDFVDEVDEVLVNPYFIRKDKTDGPIVGHQVHVQDVTNVRLAKAGDWWRKTLSLVKATVQSSVQVNHLQPCKVL